MKDKVTSVDLLLFVTSIEATVARGLVNTHRSSLGGAQVLVSHHLAQALLTLKGEVDGERLC